MLDDKYLWDYAIAVLLAAAGGLARLLSAKGKTKLKWGKICSELFVSGFAGIIILMAARASGLSGDWLGVVCGMSGWLGPKTLEFVSGLLSKKFGHHDPEEKEKKD